VSYVKTEWGERVVGKFHEDEIYSALLKAGKKYYKDPATAYEEHVWVYSAVWAVANAAAMLPTKMFKLDEEKKKIEIPEHWLLDLLEYPNEEYSGYDLIEGTFSYLELMGDAYWEVNRDPDTKRPLAFYLMRSDRVQVVPDEKKLVKGYIYTPNMKKYALAPDEVIHFKYFSPKSEINGQGSIKATTGSLEADYLGNEYFKDFFRRGAQPSFVLEMPHRMSDPSYKRLKGALRKKQGVGKQRGIFILEEGGKYIKTEMAPKDSGEEESSIRARRSVAGAVGVPPLKLQLLEGSTYANARFQDISFWRSTMRPRLKKFYAKITMECLRGTGEKIWIAPDMFEVLMNIDEFQNESKAYEGLVKEGILRRNEARDRLGFGSVPEGDKLMVAPNLVPLEDLMEPEEEEFEGEG
jgi:HK97 family phage portal protein